MKTEHNAKYIYLFFTFALTLSLLKRLGAEGEKGNVFRIVEVHPTFGEAKGSEKFD